MKTTYDNGEEMNSLDCLEVIDWGMADKNKKVLGFIAHLELEDFSLKINIFASKTVVSLISYDGETLKTLVLRHWCDGYAGMQIVGGGAYALIDGQWINL